MPAGGKPAAQVGAGYLKCFGSELLALNTLMMHKSLVFEADGILLIKKTAPFGLDGGCPTFGVQFNFFSDGLFVWLKCLRFFAAFAEIDKADNAQHHHRQTQPLSHRQAPSEQAEQA